MSEEPMPKNYKLLKGIVITLGVLIVVMVVVIIVASIMKYNDQESAEAALVEKYQTSQIVKPTNSKPFEINLKLSNGEEIISSSNSDKGILINIGRNQTIERVILVDYAGNIIATIKSN
jgi:flagellar basal body-associated protein FliL